MVTLQEVILLVQQHRPNYADLAENYLADQEYEAGTVVKIGGDLNHKQLTADVDVFGVISTRTILNEQ